MVKKIGVLYFGTSPEGQKNAGQSMRKNKSNNCEVNQYLMRGKQLYLTLRDNYYGKNFHSFFEHLGHFTA